MKRPVCFWLLSVAVLFLVACKTAAKGPRLQKINDSKPGSMLLLAETLKDTLLGDGTHIEYRVGVNGSSNDLYLLWGKGKSRDTVHFSGLLGLGDPDYLPYYIETRNGYHRFDSDCAAIECAASLLLSDKGDGYHEQMIGVLEEFAGQEMLLYSEHMYGAEIGHFFAFNTAQRSRDTFYLPQPGCFYRAELRGDSLFTEFSSESYGEGEIRHYVFTLGTK